VCGAIEEEDKSNKKKGRRETKRKRRHDEQLKRGFAVQSLQTNNNSRGLLPLP
jgi:hypothetical protein